jgi:hypothetical protein
MTKARLYASVLMAVFVIAVTTMAVKDGMSAAVTTALLFVACAGITVGLWGTAMAVMETEELPSRRGDELSRAVVARNPSSPR